MDVINIDDEENVDWLRRKKSLTVGELFRAAGLTTHGPVSWNEDATEKRAGIYVIALASRPDETCDKISMPRFEDAGVLRRWNLGQTVVYIGRTKRSLRKRIHEFYKHRHGDPRPHKGGQDVKLLSLPLWVYWCPTDDCARAEEKMIDFFRGEVGRLPFANRVRSARVNVENRAAI